MSGDYTRDTMEIGNFEEKRHLFNIKYSIFGCICVNIYEVV